jgi:outer membrane phospholipase A
MRFLPLAFAFALAAGSARAEYILLAPSEAPVAGQPVSLYLMITNETEQPLEVAVPVQLDLRFSTAREAVNATFAADPAPSDSTIQLAPQTFRKIRYTGTLPVALEGTASVAVRNVAANSVIVSVQAATGPSSTAAAEATASTPASARSPPFFSALSAYDPMYFAVGIGTNSEATSKFQLSLKLQFFTDDSSLARRTPFLHDLYFGYTQTSIWNLAQTSSPFYDTSYQPRLFYYSPQIWESSGRSVRLGLETGLGHESNGRSGDDSRSVSTAYIKPIFTLGDPAGWHWTITPKLLAYLNTSDNPDIADYRGYAELEVAYGKADSWQFQVWGRKGPAGFATQLDFYYPLPGLTLGNLNGYLLLQYFDGYGESLLSYNQRLKSQFRLGLAVVR